jgi:hypothetical protein
LPFNLRCLKICKNPTHTNEGKTQPENTFWNLKIPKLCWIFIELLTVEKLFTVVKKMLTSVKNVYNCKKCLFFYQENGDAHQDAECQETAVVGTQSSKKSWKFLKTFLRRKRNNFSIPSSIKFQFRYFVIL